jgi:hypothetical protein
MALRAGIATAVEPEEPILVDSPQRRLGPPRGDGSCYWCRARAGWQLLYLDEAWWCIQPGRWLHVSDGRIVGITECRCLGGGEESRARPEPQDQQPEEEDPWGPVPPLVEGEDWSIQDRRPEEPAWAVGPAGKGA